MEYLISQKNGTYYCFLFLRRRQNEAKPFEYPILTCSASSRRANITLTNGQRYCATAVSYLSPLTLFGKSYYPSRSRPLRK